MKDQEMAMALTQMTVASGVEWQTKTPLDRATEIQGLYQDILKKLKAESGDQAQTAMTNMSKL